MKKLHSALAGMSLFLLPLVGMSMGGTHLENAHIDLHDQAALQRGAKYFVNYCSGCHSLRYARYSRMGKDLGLTDEQVRENLMFVMGSRIGDNIQASLRESDGLAWFGLAIPDITLVTRNKVGGPNWVYNYLKSFYLDSKRPYGVNNLLFPDVGMPDILWKQRGTQQAVYRDARDAAGNALKVFDHLEPVTPGTLNAEEFDTLVRDLTTFLTYMGEPIQLERQTLGMYVILFLLLFSGLAYLLKKEYWRDVH